MTGARTVPKTAFGSKGSAMKQPGPSRTTVPEKDWVDGCGIGISGSTGDGGRRDV